MSRIPHPSEYRIPSPFLVQLTSLDMEIVSEESKAFANTVFLKKSMYYNMRSRIVKRHAGHVIRKVRDTTADPSSCSPRLHR